MPSAHAMAIDPKKFRRPRGPGPTEHLYLANCGLGCGDTYEAVLETLGTLAGDAEAVVEIHLGEAGISYASFADAGTAERVRSELAASPWVAKFAESDTPHEAPIPMSVASTAHVEVPGLELFPDFVGEEEALELLAAVDARPWDTSIRRRVQHYGRAFDYARLRLAEDRCVEELPDFCTDLVHRIADSGVVPCRPDQLTVNEYQPGTGIAFHVDAHSAFEDGIVAITLGAGIVMELRRLGDGCKASVGRYHRGDPPPDTATVLQKNVWLPPNSMLVLRGEARYVWQHGIAWRKTDCLAEGEVVPRRRRVSLTLRAARGRPCGCAWPASCDSQNPEAHGLPTRVRSMEANSNAG